MTREERRRQVKRNRISLAFIIVELIAVCVLIPIAISKFGNKKGDVQEETPTIISADAGNTADPENSLGLKVNESAGNPAGDEGNSTSIDKPAGQAREAMTQVL